jgi:uncharacterized protein
VTASGPAPAARFDAVDRVAVAMLARSPRVAGKTRLTVGLQPAVAEALRQALLLDAIEAVLASGWPLHLFLEPADGVAYVRTLVEQDPGLTDRAAFCRWHAQPAGDLGVRMTDAMTRTLASGCDTVVLVGSDAPDLPVEVLREAARAARPAGESRDVPRLVLGPADDGGFYLVAACHAEAAAFDGVAWSRPSVLTEVRHRATLAHREVVLVAPWRDVDTPDDLRALRARSAGAPRTRAVAHELPAPYNRR